MTQVGDAPAPEATPEGAAPETPQTPEVNPDLLNRMNEFGSQLGEIKETLGQFQTGAEPQEPGFQYGQPDQQPYGPEQFGGEPQYGPEAGQQYVDEFGNPVPDGYGQPQQQLDPEQVAAQLSQALGLDGLRDDVAQMRATRDAEALKREFPDFADPEKIPKIREAVEQAAWEIAQGDQAVADRLANSPQHWRNTYLAGRARESAASETPAGGANEIQLETPGGTAPEQAEPDEMDRIVAAYERRQAKWD